MRWRAGIKTDLASTADQSVLRCFENVERIVEYRIFCMSRMVLMADVSGWRVQGRPRLGCTDGMKMAFHSRGVTVEAARQCEKDS